ncbi:MAG: hypothetical protein ACTSXL_02470 [Alphaproteobacteria bacterium]
MIVALLCFTTKFVADEQVKKAQKLEKAQANFEEQTARADAKEDTIPPAPSNPMLKEQKRGQGK